MSEIALFHGDDYISAQVVDGRDIQSLATLFRQSEHWEEVVPGMADLTAKYDPLLMKRREAEASFCRLWDTATSALLTAVDTALLQAHFEAALDLNFVAAKMDIALGNFSEWMCARSYRVTMMGFQPGFAYLEDIDSGDLPSIARLNSPRQHVSAGSIGFLGKRACIYALDGPGGWPIVGRVIEPLFRRDHPQPFLLQPGQIVRFRQP